ncbi:DUF1360 domain-containing protein [Micromonospora sp. CPCC 205371]|nr:DUF1360 domain-containing protein [Micromonospora sp. CPCC 205371]
MPTWLVVLLIFLVTHRLTRLAVKDEVPIVKVPRDAAIRFLDPTPEMQAAEPRLKGHWNSGKPNIGLFVIAMALLAAGAVVGTAAVSVGRTGLAAAVAAAVVACAALLGVVASGTAGRALAYLLECPWCMSAWIGAFVVAGVDLVTSLPVPWLVWIAASTVTGLIGNLEARHDQAYELAEIEKRRALAAEQRETRR